MSLTKSLVSFCLLALILFNFQGCSIDLDEPSVYVETSSSQKNKTISSQENTENRDLTSLNDTANPVIDTGEQNNQPITQNESQDPDEYNVVGQRDSSVSGSDDNTEDQETNSANDNKSDENQDTSDNTDSSDNEQTNDNSNSNSTNNTPPVQYITVNSTDVEPAWDYSKGCPTTLFFDESYIQQWMVDLLHNLEMDCLSSSKNCNTIIQHNKTTLNKDKTADEAQEEAVVIMVQALIAMMNMLEDALDNNCFDMNPNIYRGDEPIEFAERIDELFHPNPVMQAKIFGKKPSDIISGMAYSESTGFPFKEVNGSMYMVNSSINALGLLQIIGEWCYDVYGDNNIDGFFSQPVWEVDTMYDWVESSYRYGWNKYKVEPVASCDLGDKSKRGNQTYNANNHVYHHPIMNMLAGYSIYMRAMQGKRVTSAPVYAAYNQFCGVGGTSPWPRFEDGMTKGLYGVFICQSPVLGVCP